MITIYKIAKLAGCSPSTVSKALNNSHEISDVKKQEILAIAKKYKYIPNLSAQSLVTKSNKLLGIIYREELGIGLTHHFYSNIVETFRRVAEYNGYDIIFINSNEKMSYIEHCMYRSIKGVFIPIYDGHVQKEIHELIESPIHVLLTDESREAVPTIVSDDILGAEMACEYLLSLGHKKIYYLAAPFKGESQSISAENRLKGYKNVVKEDKVFMANHFSFESGYKTMSKIISSGDLPSALFIGSDIIALGAMKALLEKQIHIPNDISIIGYDNISILPYFTPELTTVKQETQLIGEKAAQMLIAYLEEGTNKSDVTPSTIRLPVKIVKRKTCRKI